MKISYTRLWIVNITIILTWALIFYQVPALLAHQSKSIEVLNRYSTYYFAVLMGYLSFLAIITIIGILVIKASRADKYTENLNSFLIENQNQVLISVIITWIFWIIFIQLIFLPSKVILGISSGLALCSIALVIIYTPKLLSLDTNFLFSHVLIPLGVLSLYFVVFAIFLPDGVNKVYVTKSARIFLPLTIILFSLFFYFLGFSKTKLQFSKITKFEFHLSDWVLPLLPLTSIVQYVIFNSEILLWYEQILVLLIFLLFISLLIFIVPLLFRTIGSTRPLVFLGLAFSFLLVYMPSLTRQYKWYQGGSLKIQLLVLGCVWLISWIIYQTNLRNLLYLFIPVFFVSNSFVQYTDHRGTLQPFRDQADNLLVPLVDSREPVITPNIYLLVYDSYVINDTMLSHGIDNQAQERYLEGLGFLIYPKTYSIDNTSIPSMSRVFNVSVNYYGLVQRAVSGDGIVQNMLEDFGYKTYGIFYSDYFFRGINPGYDYGFPGAKSAATTLIYAIFLGEFRFNVAFNEVPQEDYIREKRRIFSSVSDEPFFVYTHSDLPGHSTNSGVCRPNEIDLYRERLAGANLEMRKDIALIIENDPEAIVIVAGDHGPYLTKNCHYTRDEYDTSEIDRLDIQDRNGTFLAIKWPTTDYQEYDEIIVLQDIFPSIFAYIFEDQEILQSRIEPITVNGSNLSGVEVSNGIILGGVNDGEPLFP